MSTKIRKRSGVQVNFDPSKILRAAEQAFGAVGKKMPATFRSILSQNMNKFTSLGTVERIQDEVESLLLSCGHIDVYKHFSGYRSQRAMMREMKQTETFKAIVNMDANESDVVHDNANMSAETAAGMMYKFASTASKSFAKQYLLQPQYRKAFEDGHIHIHDFDYYALGGGLNCLQSPIDKIMDSGLNSGHGMTRSPKRISTASFLAMLSLETSQNEMFGGQGIPAFDFYMAPFVRKAYEQEVESIAEVQGWDEAKIVYYKDYPISDYIPNTGEHWVDLLIRRTVNQVRQAMESFIHNANAIHSRGGVLYKRAA